MKIVVFVDQNVAIIQQTLYTFGYCAELFAYVICSVVQPCEVDIFLCAPYFADEKTEGEAD